MEKVAKLTHQVKGAPADQLFPLLPLFLLLKLRLAHFFIKVTIDAPKCRKMSADCLTKPWICPERPNSHT